MDNINILGDLSYDCSNRNLKMDNLKNPLILGELVKKYYNESKKTKNKGEFEYVIELFLETFSPNFKEAYEFVVLIAEPKSRQEFI